MRRLFVFLLLITVSGVVGSCASSSSVSDEILNRKLSDASELVIAIDNAVSKADYDVPRALYELWGLCGIVETFNDGLLGESGWEYPGDVPDKYSDALFSSFYCGYLHDYLKTGELSKFAEYVGYFKAVYRCIRSGVCS